jgi:brefeldin A-inhibited guanine nucleotide-exchange protein
VLYSPGPLANDDAAYILAYSVIMLNTDAHNPQVVKKMTKPEFLKMTRGINAGKDIPYVYMSAVYDSITTNEIKMSARGDLRAAAAAAASGAAGAEEESWNAVLQNSK